MQIVATQKYTRQSPRKVRLVANQVKGLPLPQVIDQLGVIQKKSTLVILKTLRQALANAQHNYGLKIEDIELENILVTEGPRYRRWQAVSRGRAHGIIKRTCHVQVILKTADKAPVVEPKAGAQPKTKAKKVSLDEAESKKAKATTDTSQASTKAKPTVKPSTAAKAADTKKTVNRTTSK